MRTSKSHGLISSSTAHSLSSWLQHDYIALSACLLIGFVISWTIWKPGFQEDVLSTHPAADELSLAPSETTPVVNTVVLEGEEQEDQAHDVAEEEVATISWNTALKAPDVFVKTASTTDGYLLKTATENFTLGKDGYLLLTQDEQPIGKIYATPYFLVDEAVTASTDISIILVNNDGAHILVDGQPVTQHVRFE